MLDLIAENNNGPFKTQTLQHIFKQISQYGLELQEDRIVEMNGDGNHYFIEGTIRSEKL